MTTQAPRHYLSTSRAILFQLTAVLSSATGGVSSAALKTYTDQKNMAAMYGAKINNSSINAAGGITVAAGALAGSACGVLFISLMLRPGTPESKKSVLIKEVVFAALTVFALAAALVSTIITATGSAKLDTTGLSASNVAGVTAALGDLAYKSQPSTLAYTILTWPVLLCLTASTLLVSRSARYIEKNGPAVGVSKGFQEKWAEPYLDKMLSGKGKDAQKGQGGRAEAMVEVP